MSHRNDALGETVRMLLRRAGAALWAALALYCVLSLVAGQAGLISYRRLASRNEAMGKNLEALRAANQRLRQELDSLNSDADRIAREARGLGYLRPGERELIVPGRTDERQALETGTVLPSVGGGAFPDAALKAIALGAFLAVLAVGSAPRRKR